MGWYHSHPFSVEVCKRHLCMHGWMDDDVSSQGLASGAVCRHAWMHGWMMMCAVKGGTQATTPHHTPHVRTHLVQGAQQLLLLSCLTPTHHAHLQNHHHQLPAFVLLSNPPPPTPQVHSNCFLSGTDVQTQLAWQRYTDAKDCPWLAIVVSHSVAPPSCPC